jgi:hypothetical protein
VKYSNARPLVEAVAEVEAASAECARVNRDDNASQEDVIAAAEIYARAIGKRNRAYDQAIGAQPQRVELGERASGIVSDAPHVPPAPAQAEGTVEPGAAEKTREAGTGPVGDGAAEAAAAGDGRAGPGRSRGQHRGSGS